MKKSIFAFLAVAVAASAFAQQPAAAPAAGAADPVVITYAGQQIHQSELDAALAMLPAEYQSIANGAGKKSFAEDYVRMKMLALKAEQSGLDKDPAVSRQLKLMRDNTLANAQLQKLQEQVKISDADLQKMYDEKKSTFEQAKARHILIAFKGSPAAQSGKKELTDEEAKAKAEDIRKKLVAGADFAATAKAESDDTMSGARGGDLGSFSRGRMVPEFEDAVFNAKPGEITPVVRTKFGYHIIQVQEKTTAPLSEVKEQLEEGAKQAKLQEMLDAMNKEMKVTYDDKYFAASTPPPTPAPAPAPGDSKN